MNVVMSCQLVHAIENASGDQWNTFVKSTTFRDRELIETGKFQFDLESLSKLFSIFDIDVQISLPRRNIEVSE
jgi:hypothetical protein